MFFNGINDRIIYQWEYIIGCKNNKRNPSFIGSRKRMKNKTQRKKQKEQEEGTSINW